MIRITLDLVHEGDQHLNAHTEQETFLFNTKAEADAFMMGVSFGLGFDDYRLVVDERYDE